MIYVLGRIAWYITIGAETFWVTEQNMFATCPGEAGLRTLHQMARDRLRAWVAQRDATRQARVQAAMPAWRAAYRRPADPVAHVEKMAEDRAAHERHRLWEAARLNQQHKEDLTGLMNRIAMKERIFGRGKLAQWASEHAGDGQYVAAMFELYAQGRTRLL